MNFPLVKRAEVKTIGRNLPPERIFMNMKKEILTTAYEINKKRYFQIPKKRFFSIFLAAAKSPKLFLR